MKRKVGLMGKRDTNRGSRGGKGPGATRRVEKSHGEINLTYFICLFIMKKGLEKLDNISDY